MVGLTGQIQNKAAFSNFSVDILVQTWKSGHELDWEQNQKLMQPKPIIKPQNKYKRRFHENVSMLIYNIYISH